MNSLLALTPSLKPYRNEATLRLRNSSLGLVGFSLLTYLLPLPDPFTSLRVVLSKQASGTLWSLFCGLELAVVVLFGLNIFQAAIALRFPRKPHPAPATSPLKGLALSPPSKSQKRNGISPNTSPQLQRSFSSFGSASFSSSTAYAPSPLSTPTRVINYAAPSPNASMNSSGMSVSSPSPMVASYRARHGGRSGNIGTGRALDSSLLQRLAAEDSDSD